MSVKSLNLSVRAAFPDFSLDVEETIELQGIHALFGPSGGGKSTLLRIIAGLEESAEGAVSFNGSAWQDRTGGVFQPAHKRPVGMVFQDTRLFTHLNVEGNLRFALKRAPDNGRPISYDQVLSVLDLEPLLKRNTSSLSGGERQRVALGRTLLSQPELLLLDEPMSALDVRRKGELIPFIEKVPEAFNLPMIFVSHAVDEVVRLADDAIILRDGKVAGRGPLPDIFQGSEMHGLTGNFEAGAVVEAKVVRQDTEYQLTLMETGGQELQMPMVASLSVGDEVRLRIRARDVSVAIKRPEGLSTRNCLGAKISELSVEHDTAFAEVTARLGDQAIRARITRQAVDDLRLEIGKDVFLLMKSVSFDRRVLISSKS